MCCRACFPPRSVGWPDCARVSSVSLTRRRRTAPAIAGRTVLGVPRPVAFRVKRIPPPGSTANFQCSSPFPTTWRISISLPILPIPSTDCNASALLTDVRYLAVSDCLAALPLTHVQPNRLYLLYLKYYVDASRFISEAY